MGRLFCEEDASVTSASTHLQAFIIVSECQLYGNLILRLFGETEFFLLYRYEQLITNNGLMGTGIEIPFHGAVVFDLDSSSADCLL